MRAGPKPLPAGEGAPVQTVELARRAFSPNTSASLRRRLRLSFTQGELP